MMDRQPLLAGPPQLLPQVVEVGVYVVEVAGVVVVVVDGRRTEAESARRAADE